MKKVSIWGLLIILILGSTCSQQQKKSKENGNTYVLVHGAYHGAWCWQKLSPFLEEKGHRVFAIDLPSHGKDTTPLSEVTMDSYANKVAETVNSIEGKVILVGHSLGGAVISVSAERIPDKIESLVYISAVLPKNGQTVMKSIAKDPNPSGIQFAEINEEEGTVKVKPEKAKEAFYHDCEEEDLNLALANLTVQSLTPFNSPMILTDERFGSIPRNFIACKNDRIVSIEKQEQWYEESECKEVFLMNTGHSPFFADPEGLAKILHGI